jgi:hypothetical protein
MIYNTKTLTLPLGWALLMTSLFAVISIYIGISTSQAQYIDRYDSKDIIVLDETAVCEDFLSDRLQPHHAQILPTDMPAAPEICYTTDQIHIQIPMYHYVRPTRRDSE